MYQKFSAWLEANGDGPIPGANVGVIDAFLVYNLQSNAHHIRVDKGE